MRRRRHSVHGRRRKHGPSGLFRRIYLTFVLSVVAAAAAAAVGTWLLARGMNSEWIGEALQVLAEENDSLVAEIDRPQKLRRHTRALARELRTRIAIYDPQGNKLAGEGPDRAPKRARRVAPRLLRGLPFVRQGSGTKVPLVLYPLTDPVTGETAGVVQVTARRRPLGAALTAGVLMLGFLGFGAYGLSRSLTRRLGRLERSAGRIATGELSHRVELGAGPPRDEIDELGVAFNDMAEKVQTLIVGQQSLLANVSHELRTPIARVKVLIEILQERAEAMERNVGTGDEHVQRLRRGLEEMSADTREIEALISDLLTSGRLELRAGAGGLQREQVDVDDLVTRSASKFSARLSGPSGVVFSADGLLLERMLSNLLGNARRACPDGEITVHVARRGQSVEIAVEDEGPGIEPEQREAIFEPFSRLDAARDRDRGGVGLGLYLCRQISRAHGGTIEAQARADGRTGARMVVTLPLKPE